MKVFIISATAAMVLAGCAEEVGNRGYFNREAGAQVDSNADFGNATMNNQLAQTGRADLANSLGVRFAQEVTPTVNFAFNSAALDGASKSVLSQQAAWIGQFPEVRFKVYGHTDLVGSQAANRALGLRRANAVVSYLASQGIDRSRLQAVVSHGETRPVVQTPDMNRQNRRTVTEVSGFVDSHPSVLNGRFGEVVFREYVGGGTTAQTVTEATGEGG